MAMFAGMIPVVATCEMDLKIEIAGADDRDGDLDAVIERGGHPGVVAAAGRAAHADAVSVNFRPGKQVLERALGLILGEALLAHAHQERADAAVITRGNAALALAERVEAEDHEATPGHINAESLEVRQRFAVGPPVSVIEKDGRRGRFEAIGNVEVGGNLDAGQSPKNHLCDASGGE